MFMLCNGLIDFMNGGTRKRVKKLYKRHCLRKGIPLKILTRSTRRNLTLESINGCEILMALVETGEVECATVCTFS